VAFAANTRLLDTRTAPEAELLAATSVVITYTEQKNANRGEKVGQGRSGDPFLCPVTSLARRIIHLRRNRAPLDTPIYVYYPQFRSNPQRVASTTITELMRRSARLLQFPEDAVADIHARALRATGASALLTAQIDSDLIRLLGRWKSDAMLRYLHAQSAGLVHQFASQMLRQGAADIPITRRVHNP
jgi:integrase